MKWRHGEVVWRDGMERSAIFLFHEFLGDSEMLSVI